MTQIIDGKMVAEAKKKEIAAAVAAMIDAGYKAPHLAAIIVGDDAASHTYVQSKGKAAQSVGITSSTYRFPASTSESDLLKAIDFLNNDDEVDGFIVQLPLPIHISGHTVMERINPAKDVDGFHPVNVGRMVQNLPCYLPATPYGIIQLLEYYRINTKGKHCVVLGRSQIVGTPIAMLLSRKTSPGNCTVTICHSYTSDLPQIAATADILIAAMGQPEFVTADMVKEGAVVIDVGIHRMGSKEEGTHQLIGDVKYADVSKKTSWITPVPGGVGPMTIVSLLSNTLKAARQEIWYR